MATNEVGDGGLKRENTIPPGPTHNGNNTGVVNALYGGSQAFHGPVQFGRQ